MIEIKDQILNLILEAQYKVLQIEILQLYQTNLIFLKYSDN